MGQESNRLNTEAHQFPDLIYYTILEKMTMFMFIWERWPGCLSPDAEFTKEDKLLPNISV